MYWYVCNVLENIHDHFLNTCTNTPESTNNNNVVTDVCRMALAVDQKYIFSQILLSLCKNVMSLFTEQVPVQLLMLRTVNVIYAHLICLFICTSADASVCLHAFLSVPLFVFVTAEHHECIRQPRFGARKH